MVDADSLKYSDLNEDDTDAVMAFMAVHFYPREPLVGTAHCLVLARAKFCRPNYVQAPFNVVYAVLCPRLYLSLHLSSISSVLFLGGHLGFTSSSCNFDLPLT